MRFHRSAWLLAAAMLLTPAVQGARPQTLQFVTKEFPPYAFVGADGQPSGPMVELLRATCAQAGLQCAVQVFPWRRAYRMIEAGEVDGVFPIVESPEQRARYQLSPRVVPGRYVLLGKAHREAVALDAGLGSRTIATFGPSYASLTLNQLVAGVPATRLEVEPDHKAVVHKLRAGRYGENGLALVNEWVAQRQLADAAGSDLQTVAVVKDLAYTYAFVPKPGSETVAIRFSDALNEVCRSGQMAATFKPYGLPVFGCQATASPKPMMHGGVTASSTRPAPHR